MARNSNERKLKFSENERVLCYQRSLIYEAKCLKTEIRESNKHFYLIHYSGWKKHWDEWVHESRVLKYNENNIQKQKELLKRRSKDKMKRGYIKSVKSSKTEKESEKRKLADSLSFSSTVTSTEEEPEKKKVLIKPVEEPTSLIEEPKLSPKVNIIIPDQLKVMLVDDWDLVSRQKQLFHLPAKFTVHKIFRRYITFKSSLVQCVSEMKEAISSLQEYFNVMLGSQLLYKFERPQYGDMLERFPHLTVSQIYGPFHLLRFFVQFGLVLPCEDNISVKNMKLIDYYVHDCLNYISENRSEFFNCAEYEIAPAEYHRRAMT